MKCINEQHVVRELWRTNARIEIFLSSANPRFGASEWQQSRVKWFLDHLDNELQNIHDHGISAGINIYQYDAPASLRAVMLDDKILTFGPYIYQKHDIQGYGKILDVRGGELPLLLLRAEDPELEAVRNLLLGMIENWKREGVVSDPIPFDIERIHGARKG